MQAALSHPEEGGRVREKHPPESPTLPQKLLDSLEVEPAYNPLNVTCNLYRTLRSSLGRTQSTRTPNPPRQVSQQCSCSFQGRPIAGEGRPPLTLKLTDSFQGPLRILASKGEGAQLRVCAACKQGGSHRCPTPSCPSSDSHSCLLLPAAVQPAALQQVQGHGGPSAPGSPRCAPPFLQ